LSDLAQELEAQAERVGVRAGEGAADRRPAARSSDLENHRPRSGFSNFDPVERNGAHRGW